MSQVQQMRDFVRNFGITKLWNFVEPELYDIIHPPNGPSVRLNEAIQTPSFAKHFFFTD
jgi:hypothetical protein